jgi:hypothetical protein
MVCEFSGERRRQVGRSGVRRMARVAPFLLACHLGAGALLAETIPVRHVEGVVRGFLALRALDGALLGNGDLIQTASGGRVTSRLVFHFKDGSIQDETAVFTEKEAFRLVSDHLIQRGPSFPHPVDVSIDAEANRVAVRYRDDDGKEKVIDEGIALPSDLVNGIALIVLKNIPPEVQTTSVSMLAAGPKPRLVKLVITRVGEDSFFVGSASHKATRFNVKVEIGGLAGLLAPLVGKQPHDTSVWILGGEAPGFVRSEGSFYPGGPLWRIELASPVWRR